LSRQNKNVYINAQVILFESQKGFGEVMIEVVFLGVGGAFDENLPNTSILVRSGEKNSRVTLLLDCGFTAVPQFWREVPEADGLDAVWISHFHGDHFFGVPALLVRFWEEGREKALTFLGQRGIDQLIRKSLDLAYPGFHEKLTFPLRFLEVEPEKDIEAFGLHFQAAENAHSQRDLALRIEAKGIAIYYSGDGRPTAESMALSQGSQLIIQESFEIETESPGHGSVKGSIELARKSGASQLALVHIKREVRSEVIAKLEKFQGLEESLKIMVPEPGTRVIL
jgi:ribonuclease BN (tRNA processing enzyme)